MTTLRRGDVVGLAFPTDAVKTLMLGLSRVADEAFKRMLQDDSARLIHPVESLSLQPAPGTDQPVLIIRTSDDFQVAFAIEPEVHDRFVQRASDLTRRFAGQPVQIN